MELRSLFWIVAIVAVYWVVRHPIKAASLISMLVFRLTGKAIRGTAHATTSTLGSGLGGVMDVGQVAVQVRSTWSLLIWATIAVTASVFAHKAPGGTGWVMGVTTAAILLTAVVTQMAAVMKLHGGHPRWGDAARKRPGIAVALLGVWLLPLVVSWGVIQRITEVQDWAWVVSGCASLLVIVVAPLLVSVRGGVNDGDILRILNVTQSEFELSRTRVRKHGGKITIAPVPAKTKLELGAIAARVAAMLPHYMVERADHNAIVLGPITSTEYQKRSMIAESGGLIASITAVDPSEAHRDAALPIILDLTTTPQEV